MLDFKLKVNKKANLKQVIAVSDNSNMSLILIYFCL